MPIASGFSVQRNDIVDVIHRSQKEIHNANSGTNTYLLRSKPDFTDKTWDWDIRLGGVRLFLDRTQGKNILKNNLTAGFTEIQEWVANSYEEGSTLAGEGSIKYVSGIGEFGALVFSETAKPITGETLNINYIEAMEKFTGNDGGLFFQLAHDLCIHPFETPEIFRSKFSNNTDFVAASPTGDQEINEGDYVGEGFKNTVSVRYNHDFGNDGSTVLPTQRQADQLWKVVTEHRETATKDMSGAVAGTGFSAIDPADDSTYITLMDDFPLIEGDLGSGEFRVSLNGRVLPKDDYVVSSDVATRKSTFKLKRNPSTTPMTWITDMAVVNVVIAYHWGKTIDVPYGALVGPKGLGPDQSGTNSWPKTDSLGSNQIWDYSTPQLASDGVTGLNGFIIWPQISGNPNITEAQGLVGSDVELPTDARKATLSKISEGDVFNLTFQENDEFATPFRLIHPMPASNHLDDVKAALRRITNNFLVESEKGVDLLSDTNLNFLNSLSPAASRKPQKWRIRFDWLENSNEIKVNVATDYQLKDDMSISQPQGRDGIKSPVYREPGELCDVYKEPAIGKGANLSISTAKSQWFRRPQIVDEITQTYPMSYRITCTDHGIGLFLYGQSAVDQDDDYAWLVVQRHVDQTTGQPEFTEKAPVHCVYSPAKRPVDISSISNYYSTDDLADLSPAAPVSNSLGTIFKTEGPTVWIDKSKSIFNGLVNAIDFNSFGYAAGASGYGSGVYNTDVKSDLYRGITGAQGSATETLWSQTVYVIYLNPNSVTALDLIPGMFIAEQTGSSPNVVCNGGRVVSWNNVSGELVFTSSADPSAGFNALTAGDPILIGTSPTGNVTTNNDFTQTPSQTAQIMDLPGGNGDMITSRTRVPTDLAITGFNSLPRRRATAFTMGASNSPNALDRDTNAPDGLVEISLDGSEQTATTAPIASWVQQNDMAPSPSRNVIFPENFLDRVSTFAKASSQTGASSGVPAVPDPISISDYTEGDSALLDILYNAQQNNAAKVMESMVVTLDDVEVRRDNAAYVLTYDDWVVNGDPTTAGRFLEMLEAAGVETLGSNFKLPAEDAAVVPNLLGEAVSGTINNNVVNSATGRAFFLDKASGSYTITTSNLTKSSNKQAYTSLLPGDIVWTDGDSTTQEYIYDFMNKTLVFKHAPRSMSNFSISLVNYTSSNPSQNTYIISTPEDRNFPETNMNEVKTINRFIVREQDVLKPWDYHVSATMHEIDSHAIINPQEQLSITQDRNFVFSFPTQITSQRFYYPQSELDLICVSSADFSTQAGHVEINKYGDSDGINGPAGGFGNGEYIPTTTPAMAANQTTRYAGHDGPDQTKYIWRKDARKYEGMVSTLPDGNGMRIFMQVTGSSIRYSDVTEGKAPGSVLGE